MGISSARRHAARAAAVLGSGALALGLAQAPSPAADRPAPQEDRLSIAELRELAARVDVDSDAGAEGRVARSRRVDVVRDLRGDADRFRSGGSARGPRPYTRLADLTRVRYKTPSTEGGDLRITTRWADLVDGRDGGRRNQFQVTFLSSQETFYIVEVSNTSNTVRVFDASDDFERVRPDDVSIRRTFGRNGTTDVILSSEWVDGDRLTGTTFAVSGAERGAIDETDDSRVLLVGPVDR